jgi:nuclear pore complex protein Nup205
VTLSPEQLSAIDQISTLLNISQLIAAPLTIQSEELRSRYPNRSLPEIANYTLHTYFSQLLGFLIELLRLTSGPLLDLSPPFDDLRDIVQGIVETRRPVGVGFLADGILEQLDAINEKLDSLVRDQSGNSSHYEFRSFRVAAWRSEQGKLAGVLAGICEGGLLGRKQVLKILDWLKKRTNMDAIVGTVLA